MRGKRLRSSSGLVNHDTEMPVSILTFNRLWCGRRRVTMLFVATPERVLLKVKPVRSRLIRIFVRIFGIAPDLFAANAGFGPFMTAFYKDQRYDGDAFLHEQNPFARRNVTAIVLEVPSDLIGKGKINAWATISLFGHAPEVQVSRWGLPMVTHLFLNDPSDQ